MVSIGSLFLRFLVRVLVIKRVQVAFRLVFALLGERFLLGRAIGDLRLEGPLGVGLGAGVGREEGQLQRGSRREPPLQ